MPLNTDATRLWYKALVSTERATLSYGDKLLDVLVGPVVVLYGDDENSWRNSKMRPELKILIISATILFAGLALFGWSVIPIDPEIKPVMAFAMGYATAMAGKKDVNQFCFGMIVMIIMGFVGYIK